MIGLPSLWASSAFAITLMHLAKVCDEAVGTGGLQLEASLLEPVVYFERMLAGTGDDSLKMFTIVSSIKISRPRVRLHIEAVFTGPTP